MMSIDSIASTSVKPSSALPRPEGADSLPEHLHHGPICDRAQRPFERRVPDFM
jgi:hypothetical protein